MPLLSLQQGIAKLVLANQTNMSKFRVTHSAAATEVVSFGAFRRISDRDRAKLNVLADSRYRFIYVNSDGRVQVLHCPVMTTDTNVDPPEMCIVARRGDNVGGSEYITFPAEEFSRYVLGICSEEVVRNAKMWACDIPPTNLVMHGDDADQDDDETDNEGPERATVTDLGWVEGSTIRLATVEMVCPVPPGCWACDGHDLRVPLPEDTQDRIIHPTTRAFVTGWSNVINTFGGFSVHRTDQYQLGIRADNFLEGGEFQAFAQSVRGGLNATLSPTYETLPETDPLVQSALPAIQDKLLTLVRLECDLLPRTEGNDGASEETRPARNQQVNEATGSGAGNNNGNGVPPIIQIQESSTMKLLLENLQSSTEGSKTVQTKKRRKEVQDLWRLLLASKETNEETQAVTMTPARLSPSFVDFMDQTDTYQAQDVLRQGIADLRMDSAIAN